MVVLLDCLTVEEIRKKDGDTFTNAVFLDADPAHKLTAFLRYGGDDAGKFKPGEQIKFAITGLGPVKEDKSSYYLRGSVVRDK